MRTLTDQDRFWIRNVGVGEAKYQDRDPVKVAAVRDELLRLGASEDWAEDKAGFLLWALAQMASDRKEAHSFGPSSAVRSLADAVIMQIDAIQSTLNPHVGDRLYTATAKALALLTSDEPEILTISGLAGDALAEKLAGLDQLRAALTYVVVAHSRGPGAGREPHEMEAEALRHIGNAYAAATGAPPTSNHDPYAGRRGGKFVAFADFLCGVADVKLFTDREFQALHDEARARQQG